MEIFIDMDSVIADFIHSPMLNGEGEDRGYGNYPEMYEVGFFESLPVVPGALSAVREIIKKFPGQVYILTQPVSDSHHSYSEKAAWICKWFPELKDKITMTQNKEFLAGSGRILIDDNANKWQDKWEKVGGTFIWFNDSVDPRKEWKSIVSHLFDEASEQARRNKEKQLC